MCIFKLRLNIVFASEIKISELILHFSQLALYLLLASERYMLFWC